MVPIVMEIKREIWTNVYKGMFYAHFKIQKMKILIIKRDTFDMGNVL